MHQSEIRHGVAGMRQIEGSRTRCEEAAKDGHPPGGCLSGPRSSGTQ